jgi:hypothetical protein
VWSVAAGYFTCVIHHKKAPMRAVGITALQRLVTRALHSSAFDPPQQQQQQGQRAGAGGEGQGELAPRASARDSAQCQRWLLDPFKELARNKHPKTRLQVLEALHSLLENSGQKLSAGWLPVLLALQQIVATADVDTRAEAGAAGEGSGGGGGGSVVAQQKLLVASGFKSLTLVANVFLDCLDEQQLKVLVETAGW